MVFLKLLRNGVGCGDRGVLGCKGSGMSSFSAKMDRLEFVML